MLEWAQIVVPDLAVADAEVDLARAALVGGKLFRAGEHLRSAGHILATLPDSPDSVMSDHLTTVGHDFIAAYRALNVGDLYGAQCRIALGTDLLRTMHRYLIAHGLLDAEWTH
jgi:hypothetical protein